MKNCMVAQSGGPTTAINASLAGVLEGVSQSAVFQTVYGARNGIVGLLEDRVENLNETILEKEGNWDLLFRTPAMYLGSCRYRLPDPEEDGNRQLYEAIFQQLEKYEIAAFFYIGGNDSMDTVAKLSRYAARIDSPVSFIGIPKTIDNDLTVTDHAPGYGSAAKYVASSMLEIYHDTRIYPVKSITIVEIMGRDAGWLTAASALARNEYCTAPNLIYLPEVAFDKERFLADVERELKVCSNLVIAVSEGIKDADGRYVSAGVCDAFGHEQLSGAGKTLEYIIRSAMDIKVRSVEINILQRCAAHMASLTDLTEARELGRYAVSRAAAGETGKVAVMKRCPDKDGEGMTAPDREGMTIPGGEEVTAPDREEDNSPAAEMCAWAPYRIIYELTPVENIANVVRHVPREWIAPSGNDVTPELVAYMRPLIVGEVSQTYQNGLPVYLN